MEGVSATSLRWWDVASNVYDTAYSSTYTYDDATVTLTYGTGGDPTTLSGHLSAVNLKPNFAYQVKLEGKPSGTWGDDGDDAANENIGFLGRWWRVQPSPGNSSDADYLAHRDDPARDADALRSGCDFGNGYQPEFVVDSCTNMLTRSLHLRLCGDGGQRISREP